MRELTWIQDKEYLQFGVFVDTFIELGMVGHVCIFESESEHFCKIYPYEFKYELVQESQVPEAVRKELLNRVNSEFFEIDLKRWKTKRDI